MSEDAKDSDQVDPLTGAPPELVAYPLLPDPGMTLEPAPRKRGWMDATRDRFAYRCLPMVLANQAGWALSSEHTVLLTWDGGTARESIQVECLRGDTPLPVSSHFGEGVVTWSIPYLFRTSPGYDLLMRGPANWPKDGISPLEGLVEADWSMATATMNWKLTRPGLTVRIDVGDPICVVLPVPRAMLEAVEPRVARLDDDRDAYERHRAWAHSRSAFNAELPTRSGAARKDLWQKDYFLGRDATGAQAKEHRRKITLREFSDPRKEQEG